MLDRRDLWRPSAESRRIVRNTNETCGNVRHDSKPYPPHAVPTPRAPAEVCRDMAGVGTARFAVRAAVFTYPEDVRPAEDACAQGAELSQLAHIGEKLVSKILAMSVFVSLAKSVWVFS